MVRKDKLVFWSRTNIVGAYLLPQSQIFEWPEVNFASSMSELDHVVSVVAIACSTMPLVDRNVEIVPKQLVQVRDQVVSRLNQPC